MLDRMPQDRTSASGAPSHSEQDVFVSLVDVFRFLLSNLPMIVVCTVLAVAAALGYLNVAKPKYTAQAELLITAQLPQLLRGQLGDAGLSLDSAQIESQIAVLRSEQIALIVINKLGLIEKPESVASAKGEPAGEQASSEPETLKLRDAIARFQHGLQIRRQGLSYVIQVAYIADNPNTAALYANAAADAFIEDQLMARAKAARQGSQWLEERIEELRVQMNQAALKVQEFKARRDYRIIGSRTRESDRNTDKGEEPLAEKDDNQRPHSTLEELESTALTFRKMYESYLQAYTESVQRQSYPGTNARVISRATPPLVKSSPRPTRLLLAGLVGGALFGLGLALIRQAWRYAAGRL